MNYYYLIYFPPTIFLCPVQYCQIDVNLFWSVWDPSMLCQGIFSDAQFLVSGFYISIYLPLSIYLFLPFHLLDFGSR
jgi:hypothetical protein